MAHLHEAPSSYTSTAPVAVRALPKVGGTRKRARRACVRCKARKVRCDAIINTVSCTNCRLDQVECYVEAAAVGKRQRQSLSNSSHGPSIASQSTTGNTRRKGSHEFRLDDFQLAGHQRPQHETPPISPPDSCRDSRNYQSTIQQPAPRLPAQTRNALHEPSSPLARLYTDSLPSFIRPLPPRISNATANFLLEKGALSIPFLELRNALWQAYVRYMRPYLPLLDLQNFSAILEAGDTSEGQLSLLLFHGVMLAGIYFVDFEYLRNAGYTSRKACVHDVFEIVKLLYDLDYEQDRITLIQSLLLMTLWYRSPDDHKDPSHYVGLAVMLARKAGLHQVSTIAAASPSKQHFLRRLWWCCVMRDYMVGYGMSRPVHLRLCECTVPMLTIDDFDLDFLATASSPPHLVNNHVSKERRLATMCVEQAKLCEIGHIFLELQNSKEIISQREAQDGRCMDNDPNIGVSEDEIAQKTDEELATWYAELPDDFSAKKVLSESYELEDDSLRQHCSLLHMMYHTVVITVHRRHLTPSDPHKPRDSSSITAANSRQKVRNSAVEVTRLCQMLDAKGHLQYLPMHSNSCILITTIVHLLEVKFAGDSPHPFNVRALSMFFEILKKLRHDVSYMDWSYQFLESACKTANIKINISEVPEQTHLDGFSNLQGSKNLLAAKAAEAKLRTDGVQAVEFTSAPEEDDCPLVLPNQFNQEQDMNLLSPFDDPFMDLDCSLINGTIDAGSIPILDMAGRDLPAGYGETINTYFMHLDGLELNQGPSTPFFLGPQDNFYDDRALEELDWLYDPIGIDYSDGWT